MRGEELDKKNRPLERVSKTSIALRFLFDNSHSLVARNLVFKVLKCFKQYSKAKINKDCYEGKIIRKFTDTPAIRMKYVNIIFQESMKEVELKLDYVASACYDEMFNLIVQI